MDLEQFPAFADITFADEKCAFLNCTIKAMFVVTCGKGDNIAVLASYCPGHAYMIKYWLDVPQQPYKFERR